MQLKLPLAVCVILSCTMCGRALASAAERRCSTLEALLRAMKALRVQVCCLLEPLQSSLRYTDFQLFSQVSALLSAGIHTDEAWKRTRESSCLKGNMADCLTAGDLAILDRLFECLGELEREAQDDIILGCIASIESMLSEARSRSAQIGPLYTSIGFLIGLGAAIIMI